MSSSEWVQSRKLVRLRYTRHKKLRIVALGRTVAYTRVEFYSASGTTVAYGSHTKHMGKNQSTVKFSVDGEREIPMDVAKL